MMNFEQEKSEDLGENRDVDGPQEQANKKYVPPKLVAVHYNGTSIIFFITYLFLFLLFL